MKPVGFARYLSRLASSQVTFASFIAVEKSKPGTEALLLPTMPASDGPTLFCPASVAWQTAQWVVNTVLPAAGSPAPRAADELTRIWASTRLALVGMDLIFEYLRHRQANRQAGLLGSTNFRSTGARPNIPITTGSFAPSLTPS